MSSDSEATELKFIITGLLTSNPLRCTISQLCNDFVNTVGYKVPYQKLGFKSVEEYLRSIPDTVEVCGVGFNAEVKGVLKEKSSHINLMVTKQKKNSIPAHKRNLIKSTSHVGQRYKNPIPDTKYRSRIPPRIQNMLRTLILKFPDGLYCTELPAQFRKIFHEDLSYEKYNYRSLIEMCSDLPFIFHFIQLTSDDYILYDRNKPTPSFSQNEKFLKPVEISEVDWSKGTDLIPSDVLRLTETIQRCFPLNATTDILDVQIGEIYDISTFWICVRNREFQSLKAQLQTCFKLQRNRYEIPTLFLEEGLYCAVLYNNEYHRCVIVKLLDHEAPELARVLFIDYGTVGDVSVKNLWFLPKKFGAVPCQAIQAKLYNIQSILGVTETSQQFRSLVTNKLLLAEIMLIDKLNYKLEIYLADITNEDNIFYLNDKLVEEGYCRYIAPLREST